MENTSKLIFTLAELLYLCSDKLFQSVKKGFWKDNFCLKWLSWVKYNKFLIRQIDQ